MISFARPTMIRSKMTTTSMMMPKYRIVLKNALDEKVNAKCVMSASNSCATSVLISCDAPIPIKSPAAKERIPMAMLSMLKIAAIAPLRMPRIMYSANSRFLRFIRNRLA